MGKMYNIEENERRTKRIIEKVRCKGCGDPLSKKEEKRGICWLCLDDFVDENKGTWGVKNEAR